MDTFDMLHIYVFARFFLAEEETGGEEVEVSVFGSEVGVHMGMAGGRTKRSGGWTGWEDTRGKIAKEIEEELFSGCGLWMIGGPRGSRSRR